MLARTIVQEGPDPRHWSLLPQTAWCVCGDQLSDHDSYRAVDYALREFSLDQLEDPAHVIIQTSRGGRPWFTYVPNDEGREWSCRGTCGPFDFRCRQFVEATAAQLEFADARLAAARDLAPAKLRDSIRQLLDQLLGDEGLRFRLGTLHGEWKKRRDRLGPKELT